MLFLPLGISEYSKHANKVSIMGVDLNSKCLVNVIADGVELSGMNIFKPVNLMGRYIDKGYPCYMVKSYTSNKKNLKYDIKHILDYAASNPIAVKKGGNYGNLAKVREVKSLLKKNEKIDMIVTIAGYKDEIFEIELNDPKWVSFWNQESGMEQEMRIVKMLNKRDVYLIVGRENIGFDGSLKCSTLVVK